MSSDVKIEYHQKILKEVEIKLLQFRECLTGFHEHTLLDGEHAEKDDVLVKFINKTEAERKKFNGIDDKISQFDAMLQSLVDQ